MAIIFIDNFEAIEIIANNIFWFLYLVVKTFKYIYCTSKYYFQLAKRQDNRLIYKILVKPFIDFVFKIGN